MLTPDLLEKPGYYGFDVTEPSRSTRDLVRRITTAVQEQLEPAFGFAISSFKSDSRNMPVPDDNILNLGDTSLVGFLNFVPVRIQSRNLPHEQLMTARRVRVS